MTKKHFVVSFKKIYTATMATSSPKLRPIGTFHHPFLLLRVLISMSLRPHAHRASNRRSVKVRVVFSKDVLAKQCPTSSTAGNAWQCIRSWPRSHDTQHVLVSQSGAEDDALGSFLVSGGVSERPQLFVEGRVEQETQGWAHPVIRRRLFVCVSPPVPKGPPSFESQRTLLRPPGFATKGSWYRY